MESTGELSQENQNFVLETDERETAAKELLEDPVSLSEKVELFYNDVKKTFRLGNYVDRAKIQGNVGDILSIDISENNLEEFLPKGVVFRGNRHSTQVQDNVSVPFNSPFYDPYSKEIVVIVDQTPEVNGRLTRDLKYSGLIMLHEIGHAIDDYKRPERLDRVEELRVMEKVLRSTNMQSANKGHMSWFSKPHFVGLREGETFDRQRINNEIKEAVVGILEKELAIEGKYSLREKLAARGRRVDEFTGLVVDEVSKYLIETYSQASEVAITSGAQEAEATIKRRIQEKIKAYQDSYDEASSDETAKSERQAWAEGLMIARKLTQERHIKLWDGDLEELFIFIDRLINAHGLKAGRKGVKNPNNRKMLHIGD